MICLLILAYSVAQNSVITSTNIIHLALASTLLMPYILPKMHERFFYPADISSIVFAFYLPQYYWVAIAVQFCSLMSYLGTESLIKLCSMILEFTLCFVMLTLNLKLDKSEVNEARELSQT